MLKNIELQKNVITIESLAMFRPNATTLNRLTGFFTDVSQTIGKLMGNITGANVSVALDGRKFLDLLEHRPFIDYANVKIPFPKEFNSDYPTIVKTMQDILPVPESLYRDVLVPFERWLATALNDSSMMESVSQYVNISTTRAEEARKQLTRIVRQGGQPMVKVNRAVRNNKDWAIVISGVNDIANHNDNVTIDTVLAKVKDIDGLLAMLVDKLNEPFFEYRPSGAFVERLVNITYAMAAEVELYAEYQYLYGRLLVNLRDDVTQLTKLLS